MSTTVVIDPEAFDGSEQQFADSRGRATDKLSRPRFVVDRHDSGSKNLSPAQEQAGIEDNLAAEMPRNDVALGSEHAKSDVGEKETGREEASHCAISDASDACLHRNIAENRAGLVGGVPSEDISAELGMESGPGGRLLTGELSRNGDANAWRSEVAARVHRYRSRRKQRGPRYPSLRLKFEPPKFEATEARDFVQRATPSISASSVASHAAQQALAGSPEPAPAGPFCEPNALATDSSTSRENFAAHDTSAKIIEFPRSTGATPLWLDELAEPVMGRPRILDVPEVALPPPALGGILIEPVQTEETGKRPGFEVPLQSAPMRRRLLAAAVDGLLVILAVLLFGYLFLEISGTRLPLKQIFAMGAVLSGVLWAAYQYLLLVYTASTPGLRAAKLELSRFDGSPASRSLRRWRVIFSILSAVSLGMGYAWYFLDEDALCWHDRITRTYLGPKMEAKPKSR